MPRKNTHRALPGHPGIVHYPVPGWKKHKAPYGVRYRATDGSQPIEYPFGTLEAAQLWQLENVKAKTLKKQEIIVETKAPFAQYARDDYLAFHKPQLKPRSFAAYSQNLLLAIDFLGEKRTLASIRGTDISKLILFLRTEQIVIRDGEKVIRQALAEGYQRDIVDAVSRVYEHAIALSDSTGITENPTKRIGKASLPGKRLTMIDETAVLTLAQTSQAISFQAPGLEGLRNQVLAQVLLLTGLRIGELCALTWGDVNFDNLEISITKQQGVSNTDPNATVKSKKRNVYISTDIAARLKELKKTQGDIVPPTTPIFGGREPGLAICRTAARKAWKKHLRGAGLAECHPHKARHTFASIMLANGRPVALVAEQLGDSIAVVLNTYAHFIKDEADVQRTRSLLDGLLTAHAPH